MPLETLIAIGFTLLREHGSAAITAAEQTVLRRVSELERTATRRSINELAWLEKAI
jgi:hypothetical protein